MTRIGWPAEAKAGRWAGPTHLALTVVFAAPVLTVVSCTATGPGPSASTQTSRPATAHLPRAQPSPHPSPNWQVAGPVSDLSVPLAGIPPVTDPANIYASAGANMLSPVVRGMPYRIYVPNSGASSVTVVDPRTYRVIGTYQAGLNPQHVVPAYDLRMLYATNDLGNSLTPIDPRTGRRAGPNITVNDPYNMYFTPDGLYAIVVAEARQHLDFRNPHTFALEHRITVDCAGVDHIDFAANGAYLIATCEFAGRLVRIDLHTLRVVGYLNLPGSAPQDIKLDPTGHTFYVADKNHAGVWLIDAATFRPAGFIRTGPDAHGLYPSRDARYLYVTNRGNGSITVIDFATKKIVTTWRIPGGGSPDMGGVWMARCSGCPDATTPWCTRSLRSRAARWPRSQLGCSGTGCACGPGRAVTRSAIPETRDERGENAQALAQADRLRRARDRLDAV